MHYPTDGLILVKSMNRKISLIILCVLGCLVGFTPFLTAEEESSNPNQLSEIPPQIAALYLFKSGQIEGARQIAQNLVEMQVKDPLPYWILARIHSQMKDWPQVVINSYKARSAGVITPEILTDEARALFFLGGFAATIASLNTMEETLKAEQTHTPRLPLK